VTPRPTIAFIKPLLFEYRDNVGHPNYRQLMASLLKRYWWDKMILDCKIYCQHSVICNRAKPDRRGGSSLQLLRILEYPWETIGIDYVINLPKNCLYGYTSVFIMVCRLRWLTSFHATRKSLQRSRQLYLEVIVIDYLIFPKLLSPIKILSLLENFGKVLWGN